MRNQYCPEPPCLGRLCTNSRLTHISHSRPRAALTALIFSRRPGAAPPAYYSGHRSLRARVLGFLPRAETQVAEQGAGSGAFYVLVDEDGSVLGRFNLYDLENSAWR